MLGAFTAQLRGMRRDVADVKGGLVKKDIRLRNLVEALPAWQGVVTIPYVDVVVYRICQRHQRYL